MNMIFNVILSLVICFSLNPFNLSAENAQESSASEIYNVVLKHRTELPTVKCGVGIGVRESSQIQLEHLAFVKMGSDQKSIRAFKFQAPSVSSTDKAEIEFAWMFYLEPNPREFSWQMFDLETQEQVDLMSFNITPVGDKQVYSQRLPLFRKAKQAGEKNEPNLKAGHYYAVVFTLPDNTSLTLSSAMVATSSNKLTQYLLYGAPKQ